MAFNTGDRVVLGQNNGSKAFSVLSSRMTYTVEAVSPRCSYCTGRNVSVHSGTIKVMGSYFCADAFQDANAPQTGNGASAIQVRSGDPARKLYETAVDFHDTLPDPTPEEYRSLPRYEDLEKVMAAMIAERREVREKRREQSSETQENK